MRTRATPQLSDAPSTLEAMCELAWQDPDVLPSPGQLRAIRDRIELDPAADPNILSRLDELVSARGPSMRRRAAHAF